MIKRIKRISQVGVFSDANCAPLGFDKSTIIYGLNTYGKSTLCDIFQSLSQDNPELIKNRKTIPQDAQPQIVEISVSADLESTEESIIFKNGRWQANTTNEHLEVFGQSFIHDNVFTGLSFERPNKVNFTNFILGAEGVRLANTIEQLKKDRREKNKELGNSIPAFVKGKTPNEIEAFIALEVEEQLDQIKNSITSKQEILFEERKLLNNVAGIIEEKEPSRISFNGYRIKKLVKFINKFLEDSFESLQKDALEKIKMHLAENTKDTNLANSWLKQGIDIQKESSNNCPFCSQDLITVEDLILAYRSYFSDEYEKFTTTCIGGLQRCMESLESIELNVYKSLLVNLAILKDYSSMITGDEFAGTLLEYDKSVNRFQKLETKTKGGFLDLIKSLRSTIKQKTMSPHMSATPLDYNATNFRAQLIREYYTELRSAQNLTAQLLKQIFIFKEDLRTDKKTQYIQQLEEEIAQLKKKEARLEQDGDCEKYKKIEGEIVVLKNEITTTQTKMEDSQREYVETYFEMTNKIFDKLGSNDFKLKKETSDKGDRKIYGVSVVYKDMPIPKDKISVVFSESDRRALALSIFLAKVQLKSTEELEKSIIMLDDPSTSFDDNRITSIIQVISKLSKDTAQMIILTHYPNFIKRYYELRNSAKLFKIKKTEHTCLIDEMDKEQLCQNVHEKRCDKIIQFINRQTQDDPRMKIRVFFENHIRIMFRKQILELDLVAEQLGPVLIGLKDNQVISESTFAELDKYRKALNPEHHPQYNTVNSEDVRQQATEIMEFLFNIDFDKKAFRIELRDLKKLRAKESRGNVIKDSIGKANAALNITFNDGSNISMIGRAAARPESWVVDAAEQETNEVIQNFACVHVTGYTLDPVARCGQCVLLSDSDDMPADGDLVVWESSDKKKYLRRISFDDENALLYSINPLKLTAPVQVERKMLSLHRVIGVLYDPCSNCNAEFLNCNEWHPCENIDPSYFENKKMIAVEGDSIEPIARKGQKVLVEEGMRPQDCTIESGGLAVIETDDESVGNEIKRVYPKENNWILLSANPLEPYTPDIIPIEKIKKVWPLKGVIFEVAENQF